MSCSSGNCRPGFIPVSENIELAHAEFLRGLIAETTNEAKEQALASSLPSDEWDEMDEWDSTLPGLATDPEDVPNLDLNGLDFDVDDTWFASEECTNQQKIDWDGYSDWKQQDRIYIQALRPTDFHGYRKVPTTPVSSNSERFQAGPGHYVWEWNSPSAINQSSRIQRKQCFKRDRGGNFIFPDDDWRTAWIDEELEQESKCVRADDLPDN